MNRNRVLRRLVLACACATLASCAGGDGGTGPGALKVKLQIPGTVTGAWSPGQPNSLLLCRPTLSISATGEGHATWTGGTSTFTAGYGTFPFTYSAAEVAEIVGGTGISGGQTLTVEVPKAGYASFRFALTVNYAVDGSGHTGSANAAFDCDAPP